MSKRRKPKYLYDVGHPFLKKEIYECDLCNGEMWNFFEINNIYLCPNCAFKQGLINSDEYIKAEYYWYGLEELKAIVYNGEIYVAGINKKYDFEKNNKDYRLDKRYQKWRSLVFERDDYTCQECGQRGRQLNAHHIKPFKDYKELRYEVDNGITLCEKCHRELHKRLRKNGRQR